MSPTKRRQRMVAASIAETKRREQLTKELARLDLKVVEAAYGCFESDRAAAEWLTRPQVSLGDKAPVTLAQSAAGRQLVLNLLRAIEDGGSR